MDTMNLALNLLEAPDSVRLFEFLARTPNMFNVVILSPHGYFGQKDVLGKPDTGGQVSQPLCDTGFATSSVMTAQCSFVMYNWWFMFAAM